MANVNEVYTADGEELINLTKDTVSELSLLSGATAHDASGAQIVGKAQYINPNLIINSNFKINQRGQTEYTSEGYTVDGWRIYYGATLTVGTDAVELLVTNGSYNYMDQIVENYHTLVGKDIAVSAFLEGKYQKGRVLPLLFGVQEPRDIA